MKSITVMAAGLLALSLIATAQAQSAQPTEIIKIRRQPLPIFETADIGSLIREIDKSELAGLTLPWPILDQSENGMYLVEIEGQQVWIVDSTVKVDTTAIGSVSTGGAMNFADPDLAGSRGYGD
jgi:hypothetical protein